MRDAKLNSRIAGWSKRYQIALHRYLEQSTGSGLKLANGLGREAVAFGLETLAITRIHEQALTSVISSLGPRRSRARLVKRARIFFAETVVLIEKTHRAVRDADSLIHKLNNTLQQRARESVASRHRLKRSIIQRQGAEVSLKRSGARYGRLLAESHLLIKNMKHLIHKNLSIQENDRKNISCKLHDEITQGLLGIHLRLLTLQKAVKTSAENFKKEIGSTQRLVQDSARKVNRFAHEFGVANKA